jgi:hyperosmotically inducible protein
MKRFVKIAASALLAGLLSVGALAQEASRYDATIATAAAQKLAGKSQFRDVKSSVEDGIITLKGTVNLHQDKLDAAKAVRKVQNATGVRNLVEVAGPSVPDSQLQQQLSRKVYYDRLGYYDNAFNFVTVSVKNGVVTLSGQSYNNLGRDAAVSIAQRTPGVKDVVDRIDILPTSIFDDNLRIRTARAIYRDSVLGRYASDPAKPIRIIVDNGHVTLYGTVNNKMEKEIAGIRANQVPGAFSVQNNLMVEGGSSQGM